MASLLLVLAAGSGSGSDPGDRGADPLSAAGGGRSHGGPAVPRVHWWSSRQPGQDPPEEVPHRRGLSGSDSTHLVASCSLSAPVVLTVLNAALCRSHQAADGAGLVVHLQHPALRPGRG